MNIFFTSLVTVLLLFSNSCQSQSAEKKLAPSDFYNKMLAEKSKTILDVRTPEEFSRGHIIDAININVNDDHFLDAISSLDKSQPTFVYCLAGGRSSTAMQILKKKGFKKLYELEGGMTSWRANNMIENTAVKAKEDLNKADYEALYKNKPLVVINFHAPWCAPCQKMKPYMEKLANTTNRFSLVRLNADMYPNLMKELGIDGLPMVIVYAKGEKAWSYKGYISEADLLKKLAIFP